MTTRSVGHSLDSAIARRAGKSEFKNRRPGPKGTQKQNPEKAQWEKVDDSNWGIGQTGKNAPANKTNLQKAPRDPNRQITPNNTFK